jgi:asparagine synthase (glutamine-hydrolysing)
MPAPDQPSVLGDFVVAAGPDTGAWVRALEGFTAVTPADAKVQVAIRGGARHGDGWVALADLVEGHPSDTSPLRWRGRFVHAGWDARGISATSDHFSTLSIYTLSTPERVAVGTDVRTLASAPWCQRKLDLDAIYHYFNFAQIPAPRTIFTDVKRLEPATRFRWESGRATEERWYVPEYPEDLQGSDSQLAHELRERMVATVKEYRPNDAQGWGCFLSGGTDSSSIVSILSKTGKVRSFSIGFAEEGYDELGFARIAAQACGADPTFASVSRDQTQTLVKRVIESYDQPFGGASAVPTIACADLAHDNGVSMLLAGDGGDEIFGGNQRYAKDKVMEAWFSMPAPLKSLGKAVGGAVGGSSVHFLNRVENFFDRASLPNPDRFYTDDSFASDHYEQLLRPDFRRAVARDASLDFMRSVYAQGRSGGPLHRVMRLDLMMAIAQHDLRKVDGATRSTSVTVRFPYLDPNLVNWVNRLPEKYKVRGLTKRYLFKKAMLGILPEEILRKKKQGFGLPIAVWMRADRPFQDMVRDTLFSDRARKRGWWEPSFVERLMSEHERGAWDHADSLWRMFVLELWLRRWADAS